MWSERRGNGDLSVTLWVTPPLERGGKWERFRRRCGAAYRTRTGKASLEGWCVTNYTNAAWLPVFPGCRQSCDGAQALQCQQDFKRSQTHLPEGELNGLAFGHVSVCPQLQHRGLRGLLQDLASPKRLPAKTLFTRGVHVELVVSAGIEPAAAIGGGFRRALCQLSYDTVDSCLNCTGDAGAVPAACPTQPFLRKGLSLERRSLCGTEEGRYRPPHDDYEAHVKNLFKLFFRNFIHPVTTGNFRRRSQSGIENGG